jgi:lipoate-protein ligase A
MIFIENPYTNPFFNLASEEYLLSHFPNGFVMLWQNENAVVIGKHQNALAEVNLPYLIDNNISLARRISGGGTVVHDKGNLNFSIALPLPEGIPSINFRKFIDPVMAYLSTLGVLAVPSGRNDILVNDLKVSGNAEHHHRKNKLMLHHGTLLFDSDLDNLGHAIRVVKGKYHDKAVASNRSKVANISSFLPSPISFDTFRLGLQDFLCKHFHVSTIRPFSCDEIDAIEALAVSKFEKDAWNYGYSPAYTFKNTFEYKGFQASIELIVERESIISAAFIDIPAMDTMQRLNEMLVGRKHTPQEIKSILSLFSLEVSSEVAEVETLIYYFF